MIVDWDWRHELERLPHHFNHIDRWVRSMLSDDGYRCVAHNIFRCEAKGLNLPKRILSEFLDELGKLLDGEPRLTALDAQVITDAADSNPNMFFLAGLRRPVESLDVRRVVRIEEFARTYDTLPTFLNGPRTSQEIKELTDSGVLRYKPLSAKPEFLAAPEGRRPWWIAPKDDIREKSPDQLRNILGLSHYIRGSFILIDYPRDFIRDERVVAPTVLDARDHLFFRPVLPRYSEVDDGWGRTVDLSTYENGVREAVHAPRPTLDHRFPRSVSQPLSGRFSLLPFDLLYAKSEKLAADDKRC